MPCHSHGVFPPVLYSMFMWGGHKDVIPFIFVLPDG